MPELPEVYTIAADLKRYCTNSQIVDVESYSTNFGIHEHAKKLKNAAIKGIERVSKYIILNLQQDHLLIHLGMTGKLLLRTKGHEQDPYTRVKIFLQKEGNMFELRFSDKRKFGKFDLIDSTKKQLLVDGHGPELLDYHEPVEKFLERIKSRKTNIKNVLMDQRVVSALGNVYATDALWIAGIHPETHTSNISYEQADRILKASKQILLEGIENRGISMSDYVDLFGKKGRQQEFFRIYQQEKCPKCQSAAHFYRLNGRGTYYCPTCQPLEE